MTLILSACQELSNSCLQSEPLYCTPNASNCLLASSTWRWSLKLNLSKVNSCSPKTCSSRWLPHLSECQHGPPRHTSKHLWVVPIFISHTPHPPSKSFWPYLQNIHCTKYYRQNRPAASPRSGSPPWSRHNCFSPAKPSNWSSYLHSSPSNTSFRYISLPDPEKITVAQLPFGIWQCAGGEDLSYQEGESHSRGCPVELPFLATPKPVTVFLLVYDCHSILYIFYFCKINNNVPAFISNFSHLNTLSNFFLVSLVVKICYFCWSFKKKNTSFWFHWSSLLFFSILYFINLSPIFIVFFLILILC